MRSKSVPAGRTGPARRWYLLIHQLPPRPLYLRARIRQRLARVGAVALKNSVYVLPFREHCLEDFQRIAGEAASGGGQAYVCTADFADRDTDEALVRRFRADRDADYAALAAAAAEAGRRLGSRPPEEDRTAAISRARRRFEEIARIDFFGSQGRAAAESALGGLHRRPGTPEAPRPGAARSDLIGRTWATRRGVHVDRIASAWLVRRFLDPGARFRFVDPKDPAREGELRFDIAGGDFSHEGDACTLETLIRRAGISDPALRPVAEIVHDIDLKDRKFRRPEAPGV
ncbi:MAG: chromate resistance protein ChrB domain-containing protein, partial [Acidobacteriota bacterium]